MIGAALRRVDDTIGELMDGLFTKKLHHCVNLVIIADHGMDDVSCRKIVRLSNYADKEYLSDNFYVWEGPFGRIANTYRYNNTIKDIWPADDPEPYDALLSNLTCASPHMNVYRKSSLPVRHHYTNNDRIDDTLLDIETGWLVTRSWINVCRGGNHGYDNIYKSMEALFLAYGPAFKWNLTIEPFENIELYNMFAEVLNITAAPNNGSVGSLNHILKEAKHVENKVQPLKYEEAFTRYKDEDEYVSFVQSYPCSNDCTAASADTIRNIYRDLLALQPVLSQTPLGLPQLDASAFKDRNVTLLSQLQCTLAYDTELRSPLWMSQTLSGTDSVISDDTANCYTPDPRLPQEARYACDASDDVKQTLLNMFTQTGEEGSTVLASGLVKMNTTFYTNTWKPVINFIRQKISGLENVNVLVGPAFDSNYDSLPDNMGISSISLPSHYFIVITNCVDKSKDIQHCNKYDIASYIIPHLGDLKMCKGIDMFMNENEARVRDVELLTGIRLLSSVPFDVAVRLRTLLPISFG